MRSLVLVAIALSGCQTTTPPEPERCRGKCDAPSAEDVRKRIEVARLGDAWGRRAVPETLEGLSQTARTLHARVAAHARDSYVGTSLYLGKFEGEHVMATNEHVLANGLCDGIALPGLWLRCDRLLGLWTDVDFGLFVVKTVEPQQEPVLAARGSPYAFDATITQGQALLTMGYGLADNPRAELRMTDEPECRVFSPTSTFRLMNDPDTIYPGKFKVWSFAVGCDTSPGDSGSPVVDRSTGQLLGLIWTGGHPKSAAVQSSATLQALSPMATEVWTQLSYVVPISEIRKQIALSLYAPSTMSDQDRRVLTAIIR